MTKADIFEYFKDLNHIYNDCTKLDTLSKMLDEFEKEEPVAQWIEYPNGIFAHLICSNCLSGAPLNCKTNYCPSCGKKMEG